jgi:hypothetical protein
MAWWPQEHPSPDDQAGCALWLDKLWGRIDAWVAEQATTEGLLHDTEAGKQ